MIKIRYVKTEKWVKPVKIYYGKHFDRRGLLAETQECFDIAVCDPYEALKALEEQAPEVLKGRDGIHFIIVHTGETVAGINGFSDDVFIRCASDDWGGEPGEFEAYMKDCLEEWYDGAHVVTDGEADEWYMASCPGINKEGGE